MTVGEDPRRGSRSAGCPAAALLLLLCALGPPGAESEDAPLLELLTPDVEMELARVPDTSVLCAAGAPVRFRLARPARVRLTVEDVPAEGSVDSGPPRTLEGLSLSAGTHRLVLRAPRRASLALGERRFRLEAVAASGSRLTAEGRLRDERIDPPVLPVGRVFVKGVDLLDGHLVHQVTDLDLEGRHLSLQLTRTYSSAGRSAAGLAGAGWRVSYESALTPLPECGLALVRTTDGSTQTFLQADDGGGFRPQRGYHTRLRRNPDGSFDFFDKADTRHHFAGPAAGTAASLRLAWMEEPHGDRIVVAYDDQGQIRDVSEWHPRLGPVRTLSFRHARAGGRSRLESVEAWGLGLRVDYQYDPQGNLIAVKRTDRERGVEADHYQYSDADRFDPHQLTATTPHGDTRTDYVYEPRPAAPSGDASSEAGTVDARVKEVRSKDGSATVFTYKPLSDPAAPLETSVRAGSDPPSRYRLNGDGNPLEMDEVDGTTHTVTRFTWDPTHMVKIAEENDAGRHERYEHDLSGNLTLDEEVEGEGKPPVTVRYRYDPRFNKLVRKQENDGSVSTWRIDPRTGDLLRAATADGKVTTWAYDPDGCVREQRDASGLTVYRRPDTFCNATEIVAPDGSIRRRRFDARGRLIDETPPAPR